MNKVILLGRLTRDPEIRYSQDGKAVARFTLAVDRRYKNDGEQSADFISCVTFGKTAEFVEHYLKKGTKVVSEGRWQTGSYEKDGQTVYTNNCIVDSLEFAESKKSNDTVNEDPQAEKNDFVNVPDNVDEMLPF